MSDQQPQSRLALKIGAGAAALVVPFVMMSEGTILHSYKDPIGIITSCVGHTGPELKMGQAFTPAQCQATLESDLLKHADDLDCIKRPMTDGQKAAFLSFAYNVGGDKFCGSTMAKKANAGDFTGACNELTRWTMAGGKELPGLVKRRAAEKAMCLRGAT